MRARKSDFLTVTVVLVSVAVSYISTKMYGRRSTARLATQWARKREQDEFWLREDKTSLWYDVDLDAVGDDLRRKFVKSGEDEATKRFVEQSIDQSESLFLQVWYNLAKLVMSPFFTQTDINGYLGRGSMFVLSGEHFERLLVHGGIDVANLKAEQNRMIDLGAGDGQVTNHFKSFYKHIFATETSNAMQRLLASNDITVLPVESWSNESYDMIACLNLLDRCDRPLDILSEAKKSLKAGGLLLVALVLPFKPFVEANQSKQPSQAINLRGDTMIGQAASVVDLLSGHGFQLLSWSRLPYLCEGDLSTSLYILDDAVFLFSAR